MSIKTNTTSLQDLLERVNTLPDAGGVDLPELTNEGAASDLLSGKQLIDGDGNKVTGTFSIDEELTTQDDLIAQIQTVVDSLPEAGASTEWIPLASLPSTYKPAPTTTYYLEVPSNIQFLLVKRSTGWAAAAYARSYDGITMSSGLGLFESCTIISDSGITYIQMVINSDAGISDLFVLPITI